MPPLPPFLPSLDSRPLESSSIPQNRIERTYDGPQAMKFIFDWGLSYDSQPQLCKPSSLHDSFDFYLQLFDFSCLISAEWISLDDFFFCSGFVIVCDLLGRAWGFCSLRLFDGRWVAARRKVREGREVRVSDVGTRELMVQGFGWRSLPQKFWISIL